MTPPPIPPPGDEAKGPGDLVRGAAGEVPIEPDSAAEPAPRRAASAEFIVEARVGSEAALRQAMDPANQSLAEALRLSYRVLQVVMVVMVALFLVSGAQTVHEGQSGVMLRFGRIISSDGAQALEPGFQWNLLPYPAGEFILFDDKNRPVDLGNAFWPQIRGDLTLQQAVEMSATFGAIVPGRDGSVLTRDGDIAHLRITAKYEIEDPVRFVEQTTVSAANRLVELALQRATVHVAAELALQDLVDLPEEVRARILGGAQRTLDAMNCGVRLVDVQVPQAMAALAIRKAFGELQTTREEAGEVVQQAEGKARERLLAAAGEPHEAISRLIDAYEAALDLDDQARADAALAELHALLRSDAVTGDVSRIIGEAQSFESQIELTLGTEWRRFERWLPAYRANPNVVVRQLWMEAYAQVLGARDAELFYVHGSGGKVNLAIEGLTQVAQNRRNDRLKAEESEAMRANMPGLRLQGLEDFYEGHRQLRVTETGVTGKRN